jgi:uncharacterized protein (TIGR02996 family)
VARLAAWGTKVTTENDFQAALDADPADWQTRLVFADWLEERADPRAAGYRALGLHRAAPILIQMDRTDAEKEGDWLFIFGNSANDSATARQRWGGCFLPEAWFKKLKQVNQRDRNPWWRYFGTRREADDIAARSFARLAKARRIELLAPAPPAATQEPAGEKKRRGRKSQG